MFGILTVAIFLPAAMGLPVYVLGRRNIRLARLLGVGTTAAELVLTLIILGVFSSGKCGVPPPQKASTVIFIGLSYSSPLGENHSPPLVTGTISQILSPCCPIRL